MADVFISYSSADRPIAKAVAEALDKERFSVWWDRKLTVGGEFDEELGQQLDQARSVVVLWSSNSVKSKWVKDEASEGLSKKALFPVMLEEVRLPFGYRRIQTADLRQWQPGQAHQGFDQLVASLRRSLGGHGGALELSSSQSMQETAAPVKPNWFVDHWRRSIALRLGTIALPALVVGAGALAMMKMHVPTRVQLDLKVEKVKFTVGGSGLMPILDTLSFSSLTVEKFRSLSFSPKSLRVADQEKLDEAPDEAKPALWREVNAPPAVVLTGLDEALQPSIRIGSVDDDASMIGKLDLLQLQPDTVVTLERKGKRRNVLIKVEGQALSLAAVASAPLLIQATHAVSKNVPSPDQSGSAVYEVRMRESSPEIKIESAPNGLTMKLGLVGDTQLDILPKGGAAIKFISLIDMSIEDKWASTLISEGKLSYPDHPSVEAVTIARSDLVGLGDLSKFSITQLSLAPLSEGLHLRLDGKAKKVALRTGEFARDARLSLLDIFRSSANAAFIVTLVLGAVSATWSLFTVVRELRA